MSRLKCCITKNTFTKTSSAALMMISDLLRFLLENLTWCGSIRMDFWGTPHGVSLCVGEALVGGYFLLCISDRDKE